VATGSRLLIFSRYPIPGKAKTRLIPVLGAVGAAQLNRQMTEATIATAQTAELFKTKSAGKITVHFTGAELTSFQTWLGPKLQYVAQPSGDLGQRMESAFNDTFTPNGKYTIGIGTDIPGISPELLDQAGEELNRHDVVLGPATDGGYYLIGMSSFHPELFANIDWGTAQVYQQTLAICTRLDLKVATLPMLNDIDRPEDLIQLRDDPRFNTLLPHY